MVSFMLFDVYIFVHRELVGDDPLHMREEARRAAALPSVRTDDFDTGYLGLPDDGYDYSQHLKEIGAKGAVFLGKVRNGNRNRMKRLKEKRRRKIEVHASNRRSKCMR
jgi:hypothetical protein